MTRFSHYFKLGLSQHQLDFVDVNNERDTPVYVDPYAIEIRSDIWAAEASENIRVFFQEVLSALRNKDDARAMSLMSHLREPKETFLGVSKGDPQGRGVGEQQARQLISAIRRSKAFKSGLLSDLSEMSLYVEGIDRDKISDLTTNIIRGHLVDYTQEQCELFGIDTQQYSGPAFWDKSRKNWVAHYAQLPYIGSSPILLVPKYIVRRKLCLDSQEFYNKQITDFLVDEHLRANSALVYTLKGGERRVNKTDVREENPKSKPFIVDMVSKHPELLDLLKAVAKKQGVMMSFHDDDESVQSVCKKLAKLLPAIPAGKASADDYHTFVMGALTALFYPDLIAPKKEWDINDGRKRVDLVYTNTADEGFFSHRRDENGVHATIVIIECKNYSKDIANAELDQLLGRFNRSRGKFGIVTCRSIDDSALLLRRCRDASNGGQGRVIALTDADMITMLEAKATMREVDVYDLLHSKYRELLA